MVLMLGTTLKKLQWGMMPWDESTFEEKAGRGRCTEECLMLIMMFPQSELGYRDTHLPAGIEQAPTAGAGGE